MANGQASILEEDQWETVSFRVPKVETEHVKRILNNVLPGVIELFVQKSNGYGEVEADDLGIKGQYADMHRKHKVLRRAMWDGVAPPPGAESLEERLSDMIGHCLKSIQFLREGRS